jgi:peptidoglycan/LPS O-acetylase OafA/YrhL
MGIFRLLLAFSVLAGHTHGHGFFGLGMLDRELAVQSFFVISGFYMGLVLNEKYIQPNSYWIFIQQRFLRLYPTYLIILCIVVSLEVLVYLLTSKTSGNTGFSKLIAYPQCFSSWGIFIYAFANLFIFGQDILFFLHQDITTGQLYLSGHSIPGSISCAEFRLNPPSWTIAVELTFYLVAPFLVRRALPLQLTVLALSFFLRTTLYYMMGNEGHLWVYIFSPSELFFFMAGSVGYHLYRNHRSSMENFAARYSCIFWIFLVFVLVYNRLPFSHQLSYAYIPLTIVMVPLLFAFTRNNKRDRLIGELSYPFYLLHFHILNLMSHLFGNSDLTFYGPASLAFTLLLSFIFYRFIEMKTERWREDLYQKKKKQTPQFSPHIPIGGPCAPSVE